MTNYQNGWTIINESGEVESNVEYPEFITDDDGYSLAFIYAIYWFPNNSDILVVRDGSYEEEFEYYLTAVSEDGKQSKDLYGTSENFNFDGLYISDNGDITLIHESSVEDSSTWGGTDWGGKVVVIGIDGTIKKEYDHTRRLFSGNGAFCWDPDNSDMGITIASYPIKNNPAWYDSLVYGDPTISDSTSRILIDSYVAYGEPHAIDCNNNVAIIGISASDLDGNLNLFRYEVESNNLLQITTYVVPENEYTNVPGAFAISPDGSKIIYTEYLENYYENTVLINSDGTGRKVIVEGVGAMSYDW